MESIDGSSSVNTYTWFSSYTSACANTQTRLLIPSFASFVFVCVMMMMCVCVYISHLLNLLRKQSELLQAFKRSSVLRKRMKL